MTDYCSNCGDVVASKDNGKYIEFVNTKYQLYTEQFICIDCLEGEI